MNTSLGKTDEMILEAFILHFESLSMESILCRPRNLAQDACLDRQLFQFHVPLRLRLVPNDKHLPSAMISVRSCTKTI